MVISPFDVITAENLSEFSFIAGDKQIISYYVYDSASSVVDLTGSTVYWTLSRYGDLSTPLLVKSGTIPGSPINLFTIVLTEADTLSLDGVFIQQPTIIDTSGSAYHPAQGKITIWPYAPIS